MNRKEPKDASSRSSIQVIGISENEKKIMRDNGIQFPGIKEKHF